MLIGELPEVEHAAIRDRERAHELHARGLGGARRRRQAPLAQAGQAGVGLVARDVAQRREDEHGVVGLARRIECLCCADAQVDIVGLRLQSHQHRLNVITI